MMVNTISIIIAIISLCCSLISAKFTDWMSSYIELTNKRDATARRYKYHGPLIVSAYDLQLRLRGLLENLLAHINDEDAKDNSIEDAFGFCTNADADPFMIWHDQQIALAEIMTIKDEDEKGIDKLVIAREEGNPAATLRLRKLQHHLIDFILVLELETDALRTGVPLCSERVKVVAAPGCTYLGGVLSCREGGR
ncbi:hypothetical protein EAF04_000121 [Stromatinia cepivora]|nr:hypothetical protein EAF04_000121 [Stromatinia cepivora]